jgi:pimeloyl-ACP methyl ester carboxylesterase
VIEREGWIVTDDGIKLYYSTIGDGPQVVVVPCGFYMTEFAAIASGRTFVLVHARARGRSEVPAMDEMGINREARDLEIVRNALEIDMWSLVGWSYGGMVTSLYAIEHPDVVDRVVHLCSLGPDQGTYAAESAELAAMRRQRTDRETLDRLREIYSTGEFENDPVRYAREYSKAIMIGQMADPASAEKINFDFCDWENEWPDKINVRWQAVRPTFEAWDERERLPSVQAPMLVVHGMADAIPFQAAQDMTALVRNARLLAIEGSGHYPWLERPHVFFPAIDMFLSGSWPEDAVS